MSYEKIIHQTKKIESILVKQGAKGRGLHEKVSSVEHKLTPKLIKKIRFVATIRNKLIHDDSFELTKEILEKFNSASKETISELTSLFNKKQTKRHSLSLWIKVGVIALIVLAVYLMT